MPLTELTSELVTVFTQLLDDPDEEIARAAGFGLHDIPADNDDLARILLSAAYRKRPDLHCGACQVISAVEHYQGHIPTTVLDIASQFFRIHGQQAGDFSSHGFHDASVLGQLVINIYDQEPRGPFVAVLPRTRPYRRHDPRPHIRPRRAPGTTRPIALQLARLRLVVLW